MALAAFPLSPLPSASLAMLDVPFAPLTSRRLLPADTQNECVDRLSACGFPSQGNLPHAPLRLKPRNSSSVLFQNGLKRMQEKTNPKPKPSRRRVAPGMSMAPGMSIDAMAQSVLKARELGVLSPQRPVSRFAKLEERLSPKSQRATVQRSSSFGRVRLSPVRSAPVRTRSCAA
ncbi:expressed unknown protein [Seminavis robusta]|uniref:Uncharacterized protein n=1 Tax=Seminavis robusta TaxID=568900 RepID=A0A9N8EFM6_9STRA|nr:expressed unknown protein [Seminavis robusta]|eukprot:Sro866_g213030.1 n/a (174) ;mRNA; r:26502-27023